MNIYVLFGFMSLFSFGIIDNFRGPIYSIFVDQYQLSENVASLFFAIPSLLAFLTNLFHKKWLAFLGSFNSLKIGLFFQFISQILFGMCFENKFSVVAVYFVTILYGLSVGLLSISLNTLVVENALFNLRDRLLSGLHSMYALASLTAPLIFTFSDSSGVKWYSIFYYFSLIPLTILVFTLTKKRPRKTEQVDFSRSQSDPHYNKFGVILALYVGCEIIVSSRLVIFNHRSWLLSLDKSSIYLSYFFIALFLGRLIYSLYRPNFRASILLRFSLVSSAVCILMGVYIDPLFLSLSAFFMSYFYPCYLAWLSSLYPKNSSSVIAQAITMIGFSIMFVHYAFGLITDIFGFKFSMTCAALMLLISLYLLQKTIKSMSA